MGHVPHGASTPRSTTMSTASLHRSVSPRKFRGTRSVAQLSEEGKREWCPTGNGTTQSDITVWNRAIATPSERGRPPTGKSEVKRRTASLRALHASIFQPSSGVYSSLREAGHGVAGHEPPRADGTVQARELLAPGRRQLLARRPPQVRVATRQSYSPKTHVGEVCMCVAGGERTPQPPEEGGDRTNIFIWVKKDTCKCSTQLSPTKSATPPPWSPARAAPDLGRSRASAAGSAAPRRRPR